MSKRRPNLSEQPDEPQADSFLSGGRGDTAAPSPLDAVVNELPEAADSGGVKPYNLRLPSDVHAELKALSQRTGVSMNKLATRLIAAGVEHAKRQGK